MDIFSLRVMLKRNLKTKIMHKHSIPNYVIHLLPPLILHNFLPYVIQVQNVDLKQHMKIESGEKTSVYCLNLNKDQKLLIKVFYQNSTWSGYLNLTPHLCEKIVSLNCEGKSEGSWKHFAINVKVEREGSCNLFFYTPYWIVNKTGLPVNIKTSSGNLIQESCNEDIVLFNFKKQGKQSFNLKVYESEWSSDFGLDCAETTGLIVCKDNERRKRYTFLLSIRLSKTCPRLTKIVTLLPLFIIENGTKKALRFMEHNEKTDLWIDLPPNQYMSFWPDTKSMQMYVKYRDSKLMSQAFYISNRHRTVLRMDKGSAITVEVRGGECEPFSVLFSEYKKGDAPILIKNMCSDVFLKIQQQSQSQVTLLSPYNSLLYTWDDPTKPRELLWNVYNNKRNGFHINIAKDGYGEEKINFHSVQVNSSSEDSDSSEDSTKTSLNKKVRRDKIMIFWACYREELQKVLFFTQDHRIYTQLVKRKFAEHCNIEIITSFTGLGISIFTPENVKKEHIYLSISDTPAVWEVNVGHKWKTLTLELASWIEDKYRLHYKKCQLKDYVHIDFEKMFMLKPFFAELRRSYKPAVYLQYRKSFSYQYLSFNLQSFQIDNKYAVNFDSNIFSSLPEESLKVSKPFLELDIFKSGNIYKDIKLNISDFYLHLDGDTIVDLARMFIDTKTYSNERSALFIKDMNSILSPLNVVKKRFYDKTIVENFITSQIGIQLCISRKNRYYLINSCTYPISTFLEYFYPLNLSAYMPFEGVRHK